jgi:hypothetical protein
MPAFDFDLNWLELEGALLIVFVLCLFAAFEGWRGSRR